MNFYSKKIEDVFSEVGSNEYGLTSLVAEKRLLENGKNALPEAKQDGILKIFLRQFTSPLVYILLFATIVVFFLKEYTDGFVILFVLLFNAVIGAIQEGRSQNALRALSRMTETKATVIRDGVEMVIPDIFVVIGDILVIREGNKISADARILFSNNLTIDEAVLTGESVAVEKISDVIPGESLPVGDQRNMVFKGTYATLGNGRAIVVETGVKTVIGDIASKLSVGESEIPLAKNIRMLSRLIIIAVLLISVFLFVLGVSSGISAREMFLIAVSVAVSMIPEGLPIVVTLILAQGVGRMAKKNVLVKKLHAVEALGQASVLAVDKTGTITKNEMMLEMVFVNGNSFSVTGVGYDTTGVFSKDGVVIDPLNHKELVFMGKIATFCSNAEIVLDKEKGVRQVIGDPTEAALGVFGEKIGFTKITLEKESPEIGEIPFSYINKYHATLHKTDNSELLTVVGAPEKIISLCSFLWQDEKSISLKEDFHKVFEKKIEEFSGRGLRILALAFKESVDQIDLSLPLEGLTFVGIVGIKDGLRLEVKDSVLKAHNAGMKVVMITGDHSLTASAIAREAGIFKDGDNVITGKQIDELSEEELILLLPKTTVFARVTPNHKQDIVNLYRKGGEIIAMTGDGVNDAPSLVNADLGVAMGITGTEVAKEASDIILLNDDFGNIIEAAEEGRNIYKNIRKTILYLFSTNIGEVLVIIVALFLGLPLPLLAVQIIWMNLVTDGFLTVAMAAEPKEKGLLRGRFEKPTKYIIDGKMFIRILVMAIPMTIGTIILFNGSYKENIVLGWTVSLTVMSVFQWFNAWNCRSDKISIFKQNPFGNLPLVFSTLAVIGLHLLAIYNPFFQKILKTTSLSWAEWKIILLVSLSIIATEEIRKIIVRLYSKRRELRLAKV